MEAGLRGPDEELAITSFTKDGRGRFGMSGRDTASRSTWRRSWRRRRRKPEEGNGKNPGGVTSWPTPRPNRTSEERRRRSSDLRVDARRRGGDNEIPLIEGMVVLDAVLAIQAEQAPDLAVRWNCKAAHCGSCSAEINGRPKLLCKSRVEEYDGAEIHVGPMRAFPVIKDLVSDVSWNYEVSKGITPFTTSEQAPFTMYEEDVERLYEPKSCIECSCARLCHVLRTPTITPSSPAQVLSP